MIKKTLLFLLVIIVVLCGVALLFYYKTKSYSPERNVVYTKDTLLITIHYNSPAKKNRKIFGELVPYNIVWRLGANEPTTFETSTDLYFKNEKLPAGKYSLWAIPNIDHWELIFNRNIPAWGIKVQNQKSNIDRDFDVLIDSANVLLQDDYFENFTILIDDNADEMELVILWDKVLVSFPFTVR